MDFNKVINLLKEKILLVFCMGISIGVGITIFYYENSKDNSCIVDIESNSSTSDITVEISGAVENPGVYKLKSDSRLVDLVGLANGYIGSVDFKWVSKNINLSRRIVDEEKIYVPFEWEVTVENPSVSEYPSIAPSLSSETSTNQTPVNNETNISDLVSVNTGTVDDLDTLPGIGPSYAQKIIDSRPYADLEDFNVRSGLGESTIEKIKDLISF